MTRQEWAFNELDKRTAEDRRYPVEPARGSKRWHAFARMKRRRAERRKDMGFSRKTAEQLVEWARTMDGGR